MVYDRGREESLPFSSHSCQIKRCRRIHHLGRTGWEGPITGHDLILGSYLHHHVIHHHLRFRSRIELAVCFFCFGRFIGGRVYGLHIIWFFDSTYIGRYRGREGRKRYFVRGGGRKKRKAD